MLSSYYCRKFDRLSPRVVESLGATALILTSLNVFKNLDTMESIRLREVFDDETTLMTSRRARISLYMFLMRGWNMMRIGVRDGSGAPGAEWSLTLGKDYIIGGDGKLYSYEHDTLESSYTFLTPKHYPYWKRPGSPWAKYLSNVACSTFARSSHNIRLHIPLFADAVLASTKVLYNQEPALENLASQV